ncbi:hypothetical protein [Oceanirhabdus sp. W0125-5]|uniref:hypothetical protein n=1 Tax=Oceanirhabdus sp. W0125-5 TaxID=2999116 RepID=UPI0022F3144D|nr:hypothetical protein [Oceanirhabdus sp. W0125-5]WBW96856.1 hypothetical protein OW730_24670 [Oceanirhabdus sp. W0125-5]
MKNIKLSWNEGIFDPTGFLHSFIKSIALSLKYSNLTQSPEDIVATTGFAFRMWAHKNLCPSAMSIFDFSLLKTALENGGFSCQHISRLWDEENLEHSRRTESVQAIKNSLENNTPPVVWDVGIPEWGLITGYNDESKKFTYLSITGDVDEMDYDNLGRGEIPILSVTIPTGTTNKSEIDILKDTIKMIIEHADGKEWSDGNTSGLKAYDVIIDYITNTHSESLDVFSMKYYLGTYASLRYYAWRYTDKMSLKYTKLKPVAEGYKKVFELLKSTYDLLVESSNLNEIKNIIITNISNARDEETKCVDTLKTNV